MYVYWKEEIIIYLKFSLGNEKVLYGSAIY